MSDAAKGMKKDFQEKIWIFVFAFFRIYAIVYLFHSMRQSDLPPPSGSSLRHWPPGTNSKNVRAVFFFSPPPQPHTRPHSPPAKPDLA